MSKNKMKKPWSLCLWRDVGDMYDELVRTEITDMHRKYPSEWTILEFNTKREAYDAWILLGRPSLSIQNGNKFKRLDL